MKIKKSRRLNEALDMNQVEDDILKFIADLKEGGVRIDIPHIIKYFPYLLPKYLKRYHRDIGKLFAKGIFDEYVYDFGLRDSAFPESKRGSKDTLQYSGLCDMFIPDMVRVSSKLEGLDVRSIIWDYLVKNGWKSYERLDALFASKESCDTYLDSHY